MSEVVAMPAYMLLIGGTLYGTAAFAGSRVYLLAGIVFGAWLAVCGGSYLWRVPVAGLGPRQEPVRGVRMRERTDEATGSMARTGVLLGMAGLFILNLVLGPIAIGLGVVTLKRGVDRATALFSVLLGVADVVVLLVLMALSLAHGGPVWHLGS
jgi:hypothetical protein